VKRSFNIAVGSLLIALSITIWTLTVICPKGPESYDVEIDGHYYIEEVIPQPSTGDLARREYIELVEISAEKVLRPPVESPFWRFWDNWGMLLSLFAFFPIFAVGVSRLMPALMRTPS